MSHVDRTMAMHKALARAVIVSDTGEESRAVALPLSLVDVRQTGRTTMGRDRRGQAVNLPLVEVAVPEWLARKEGLV